MNFVPIKGLRHQKCVLLLFVVTENFGHSSATKQISFKCLTLQLKRIITKTLDILKASASKATLLRKLLLNSSVFRMFSRLS